MSRRDFLRATGAGAATLTAPALLPGCARSAVGDAPLPDALFHTWFGVDQATLSSVLGALTERGADQAEAYFQHSRGTSIRYEDGIISQASTSIDQGVGLRTVIGDRTGYAYTEDLSLQAMLGAARTAASIAAGGYAAPPQAFSLRDIGPGYYSLAVPWSDVGIDQRLPLIERLAALANAADPRVRRVTIDWADAESRVLIADMHGMCVEDHRPMTRLTLTLTAEQNGELQTNRANISGRRGIDWYTEEQLQQLVRDAVDRTMILFDAVRPPAGEMPVVLASGPSGILLHEAIGHGMEADFNRKGTSIYADMMGEQIASDFVTIVDDGTIDNERGALNVDDEGVACERTVLVDQGRLVSYLHDSISARHYGIASTGSGRRQSFRHAPMPRMRCTFMEDGPHTRDEIVASVERGILAESFTNGQVQIGAGDYTFYIRNGWLIEDGRITAPIKDCNIIGNGPETLRRITMAAADGHLDTGGWTCGKDGQSVPVSQGIPTVLVSSLTVGGDNA